MAKGTWICVLALFAGALVGCEPTVRNATSQDKANLDKLAKEGIGAPSDTGKTLPPPEAP